MTTEERARAITKEIEESIKEMQKIDFLPYTEYDVIEMRIRKLIETGQ